MNENNILRLFQELGQNKSTSNRTGTNASNKFCHEFRFDLSDGSIPLPTTKNVNFDSILRELLWFIKGSTCNNHLNKMGSKIWNEWADNTGSLGTIYGAMWRRRPISLAAIHREAAVDELKVLYQPLASDVVDVELAELELINELNKDYVSLANDNKPLFKTWLDMMSFVCSRYMEHLTLDGVFVNKPHPGTKEERSAIAEQLSKGVVGKFELNMYGSISPSTIHRKWLSFAGFLEDVGSIGYNEQRNRNDFVRLTTYFSGHKHYGPRTAVFYVPVLEWIVKQFLNRSTPEHQANFRPLVMVDQLEEMVKTLQTRPHSRRMLVSSWEPSLMPDESTTPCLNPIMGLQALTPCHHEFQVVAEPLSTEYLMTMVKDENARTNLDLEYVKKFGPRVTPDAGDSELMADFRDRVLLLINMERADVGRKPLNPYRLHLRFSMRSTDTFLGLQFNLPSYGSFLHIIAKKVGMLSGDLVYQGTSVHLYDNTAQQALTQASRNVESNFPKLAIADFDSFDELTEEHFTLMDYNPQGKLPAPVAV